MKRLVLLALCFFHISLVSVPSSCRDRRHRRPDQHLQCSTAPNFASQNVIFCKNDRGVEDAASDSEWTAEQILSPLHLSAFETVSQADGAVPCREVRYACAALPVGEEKVLSEGSRTEARVVLYGVDRSLPAQVTAEVQLPEDLPVFSGYGVTFTYRRALRCEATAYSCEGYVGTTAIGTVARVGAIAVDPKVIPYGTRMYIVSDDGCYIYGFATAEDCGNFRGNRIDLYFNTVAECWTFGRRMCTVYILP